MPAEPASPPVRRLALVTHPTRDASGPVGAVRSWAERAGVELVELWPYDEPDPSGDGRADRADGCDAIVSIGGDGTLLSSLHAGASGRVPVLGVSWGSLAVLGSVRDGELERSLDRLAAGDYEVRDLCGLETGDGENSGRPAFNDVAVSRRAAGQVSLEVRVDGAVYARLSGDGLIVSAPMGSAAYTMAAGGPLLHPATRAFVLTPTAPHGGSCPPLVLASGSEVRVAVLHGHGRARVDVDGRESDLAPDGLWVRARPQGARLVVLDEHPYLATLRARGIVADSPRVAEGRPHHD